VATADKEIEDRAEAFDGNDFILSRRRWVHVVDRHPELAGSKDLILNAASHPDEVFVTLEGRFTLSNH